MNTTISEQLFEKAKKLFPGGVNSPVRAFKSVGGTPIFIENGEGAYIWDADGNKYLDFCGSWGPLILGHAHQAVVTAITHTAPKGTSFGAPTKLENELAAFILERNPFIEKIRFVSSGTEAVMSALRLAKAVTGKSKIIKFEGCYHGHVDQLLVKAGSGLSTFGISSSAGVPDSVANETIVLPLDDKEALKAAFEKHKDIAAIIIEGVPANNGLLQQDRLYLEFLRQITIKNNALLIFDEVITGFRLGFEGAAGYYNIKPDIITFGKIIGGGMPVGAYGASENIMDMIAPEGPVYQAGTLSGNPVAMAAGLAQLIVCAEEDFYKSMEKKTFEFTTHINDFVKIKQIPVKVFQLASIFWIAFTNEDEIHTPNMIDPAGMDSYKQLHRMLLEKGIYLAPSGYEVGFVSAAHTSAELQQTAATICECLTNIFPVK